MKGGGKPQIADRWKDYGDFCEACVVKGPSGARDFQ